MDLQYSATGDIQKIQIFQPQNPRLITDTPLYISNRTLHTDLYISKRK